MLLWNIVEYFLETSSSQAVDILSSVREPHDKVRESSSSVVYSKHTGDSDCFIVAFRPSLINE